MCKEEAWDCRSRRLADALERTRVFQRADKGRVRRTSGDKLIDNPKERVMRRAEKAIETRLALRIDQFESVKLVKAVYWKPAGERRQEPGGVVVTLLALCAHHNIRLDDLARCGIERIVSRDGVEFWKKQEAKADLSIAGGAE